MPLVSPVTVQVSGPENQVQVLPRGDEVTVYLVIRLPFVAGALQVTTARPLPGFAVTSVGLPGTAGAIVSVPAR